MSSHFLSRQPQALANPGALPVSPAQALANPGVLSVFMNLPILFISYKK